MHITIIIICLFFTACLNNKKTTEADSSNGVNSDVSASTSAFVSSLNQELQKKPFVEGENFAFFLTDAPASHYKNVYVDISSISLEGDQRNVELLSSPLKQVDLLSLNNNVLGLPYAKVSPGNFNYISVTVKNVSVVLENGNSPTLKLNSNLLRLPLHLTITDHTPIVLLMDFDVSASLPVPEECQSTCAFSPKGKLPLVADVSNGVIGQILNDGSESTPDNTPANATSYTLSVSATSILEGNFLVLKNLFNSESLTLSSTKKNGSFPSSLLLNSPYQVSITQQPNGQTCTISKGSGNITANTTVQVICTGRSHTVSGYLSGLKEDNTVALINARNNSLELSENGAFAFSTSLPQGNSYLVSVQQQPNGQTCSVTHGSGTIGGSDISNVLVSCHDNIMMPHRMGSGGGIGFSCQVLENTEVSCWGSSYWLELGFSYNNVVVLPNSPDHVNVPYYNSSVPISSAVSTSVGYYSGYALDDEGAAWGWGGNSLGQLGAGHAEGGGGTLGAIQVVGGDAYALISSNGSGFNVCGITRMGLVKCWGRNMKGILGDISDDTLYLSTPIAIDYFEGSEDSNSPVDLSLGGFSAGDTEGPVACAALRDGTLRCWGSNTYGQLGQGSTDEDSHPSPEEVLAAESEILENVSQVSVGAYHVCAVVNGGVQCWGNNDWGQLGNGTTNSSYYPVQAIAEQSHVIQVGCGAGISCALFEGGTLKCWGANQLGQLGDGTTEQKNSPVEVTGNIVAIDFFVGLSNVCAIEENDTLCWGNNDTGQLGYAENKGTETPNPVPKPVEFQ